MWKTFFKQQQQHCALTQITGHQSELHQQVRPFMGLSIEGMVSINEITCEEIGPGSTLRSCQYGLSKCLTLNA